MNPVAATPIALTANQPADRFYRGGPKILEFRGAAAAGNRVPEDWVASTTTVFGEAVTGLTVLPSGGFLRDAVASDPLAWLGADHVARFGADTKLLIKMLDAGERLPVHIHPSHEFALEHVGASHGKAEAWYILEGGTVHLGFSRDISDGKLATMVAEQDVDAILAAMHLLEVRAGDSLYVPPGLPHAIGAGVFIIEVQEPEDMSILLEWKDYALDGPTNGHIGIGFDVALTATDTRGWSTAEIEALIVHGGTGNDTLVPAAAEYFRAERHAADGELVLDAGFSTLMILAGEGMLAAANGATMTVKAGDTVLTSHALGALTLTGALSLLRCRPPV
jgi:mannose-6-phosphate isomerase